MVEKSEDEVYAMSEPVEWRLVPVADRLPARQTRNADPTEHSPLSKVVGVSEEGRIIQWWSHDAQPRAHAVKLSLTTTEHAVLYELAETLGCSVAWLIRDALAKTYTDLAEHMVTHSTDRVPTRTGVSMDEIRKPIHLQTSYVDGRVTMNVIRESPNVPPPCVCPKCLYHEAIREKNGDASRKYIVSMSTGETRIIAASEPVPYGWDLGIRIPAGKVLATKDSRQLRKELKEELRFELKINKRKALDAAEIAEKVRAKVKAKAEKKKKPRGPILLNEVSAFLKVFGGALEVRIPDGGVPPDMKAWIYERREAISLMSKEEARALGRANAHLAEGYPKRRYWPGVKIGKNKENVVPSSGLDGTTPDDNTSQ